MVSSVIKDNVYSELNGLNAAATIRQTRNSCTCQNKILNKRCQPTIPTIQYFPLIEIKKQD